MKYIDMHCDTMAEIWYAKLRGENYDIKDAPLMINLEKLKKGDCLCQNFGMYVNLERPADFRGDTDFEPPTPEYERMDPWYAVNEILKVFREQMEKHAPVADGSSNTVAKDALSITQVTTGTEIHQHLKDNTMCCLLTVEEGGVCKGSLNNLRALYAAGVRMMTLTWNFDNELGHPNKPDREHYYDFKGRSDNGLTDRGRVFVDAMQNMGMIVDVSHLSDQGFYDVAELVKGPFVASHSNARSVIGCSRNLTDEMIRVLAEHGGVTGLNFCPSFLDDSGTPKETVDRIVRTAEHLRSVGGIEVIGIGTDFDGIGGDLELGDASKMDMLLDGLKKAGFSVDEIEKIFYKNVLRVYDEVLG